MTAEEASREDDPISLSPIEFVKRAARLPVGELLKRLGCLATSLPRSLATAQEAIWLARKHRKRPVFVLLTGRMGDLIAAEPVIRHIKEPSDYVIWFCRPNYAEVLRFNPYIDKICLVGSDFEGYFLMKVFARQKWINLLLHETRCNVFGVKLKNLNIAGITAYNRYGFGSNADAFSMIAVGKKLNDRPRVYLDHNFKTTLYTKEIFKNDRPFIAFHPTSDEIARSWSRGKAIEFSNAILEATSLNLIEFGMSPLLTVGPRVFTMKDSIFLSKQMKLVAKSILFVGVDSGFSHIANAAKVPSVLMFGAHLGVKTQLPLPVHDNDIVLRGVGQTHQIEVQEVVRAVLNILQNANIC